MNKNLILEEQLEGVEDDRVLNMLKACYKQQKTVLRLHDKFDFKRYKPKYNNIVGDSEIELK